jgi:hypothetical protein
MCLERGGREREREAHDGIVLVSIDSYRKNDLYCQYLIETLVATILCKSAMSLFNAASSSPWRHSMV